MLILEVMRQVGSVHPNVPSPIKDFLVPNNLEAFLNFNDLFYLQQIQATWCAFLLGCMLVVETVQLCLKKGPRLLTVLFANAMAYKWNKTKWK